MTDTQPKPIITFGEYARFLSRYLRSRWHLVAILGIMLFATIGMQIVNPLLMRSFIDTARAGGATNVLTFLALLFIGIAIGQHLLGVVVVYITENLGWSSTNDLRLDLARCMGLICPSIQPTLLGR
jgi:ATP-binding cassette subfamily B protein